jgi:Ca2+-binding EF-hand superfamily protein
MKKMILALAFATTGLAGAAAAQPAGPGPDPMGDKTVTRAEAQAKAGEMFARMDANKDGKIDQADRGAKRAQMFDRLDANKDGSVSRDEFAAAQKARDGQARKPGEDRMGKRGDRHGGGKRGMMMLRMADANKDGTITRDEFMAAHGKHFDMTDANKDGKISPEERKAQMAKMREMRGKRGPGRPAQPAS